MPIYIGVNSQFVMSGTGGVLPPSNQAPTIGTRSSAFASGVFSVTYQYADAESNLENNSVPRVENFTIGGTPEVGEDLTAIEGTDWDFVSPSNYTEGTTLYQWYRKDEDGSNRENIGGETTDTYTVQSADQGKIVGCEITPVQTATSPANGNPSGAATTAETFVEAPFEFVDHYDQYLREGFYDSSNNRWPIEGLQGTGYASAPVGNEPVWNSGTGRLQFTAANSDYLTFSIVASTRIREFVWVGKWDSLATIGTLFGISSTNDFRNTTGSKWQVRNSSTITTTASSDTNIHSFRLRLSGDGVANATGVLQIDKDTTLGTYAVNENLAFTNTGATVTAGTARIGSGSSGANFFGGFIKLFAYKVNAHLASTHEDAMWDRLNTVRDA